MKLTKHKNGVYYASFKDQDGKWHRVSTGAKNRETASERVKSSGVAELEAAGQVTALTGEVVGRITAGKKITVESAIAKFSEWVSQGRAKKTAANTVSTVMSFCKWAGVMSRHPSCVSPNYIDSWINREDESVKLGTRKVARSALRMFFDFCSANGWCHGNPARLVRINMNKLTWKQKETKKVKTWNQVEYERLMTYFADHGLSFWRLATMLSYRLGLRLGDICQLEWDCFSVPGKIVVWTDKRDKRVAVKVKPGVIKDVSGIPITHPRLIFPAQAEMVADPGKRAQLSVQFRRHCAKAGVPIKTFHALRHTCITRWKKEGKSLEQIGEMVGHSSTKTTEGYIHE